MCGLGDRYWPLVDGGYHSIYTLVDDLSVQLWEDVTQGLVDAVGDDGSQSHSLYRLSWLGNFLSVRQLLLGLVGLRLLVGGTSLEGGGVVSLTVGALLRLVSLLSALGVAVALTTILALLNRRARSCSVAKSLALEALSRPLGSVILNSEFSEIKKDKALLD